MRRALTALLAAALLAGCGADAPGPSFVFARLGGVIRGADPAVVGPVSVACAGEARETRRRDIGRNVLLRFRWSPGERCAVRWGTKPGERAEATAPRIADPVPVRVESLEGFLWRGREAPAVEGTSFLRFGPSGRLLAMGTQNGRVRVVDVKTGEVRFETRVAEGWIKAAAFSPDGRTLFFGEQTRDGFLHAVDLASGRELWRYRLADDLGTTVPADTTSEISWITYPGPYRLAATPDGDLIAAGLHPWQPDAGGPQRQLSRLYRFDGRSGRLKWKWPPGDPAPLNLTWFDADEGMRTAVAVLGTSLPWREGMPMPPGLYAIDLANGRERWRHPFRPLAPLFRSVDTWRGVAVRPDGGRVAASTGDGRLYILDEGGRLLWSEARGGPVMLSGFPVVAETGSVGATPGYAVFALGEGYIPLQAAPQGASTVQPHPNADAVLFFGWDGALRRRWPAPNRPNGLAVSGDGRWIALALSKSRAFRRDDVNGMVLFDTRAPGGSLYAGEYRTEGPVVYDQIAVSPDGALIALVEAPAPLSDGRPPLGRSRLHLLY